MPDFDRYATGYQLTDWLTAPYWHFMGWRAMRRLDKALGITGNRQERREQRRDLWRAVSDNDLLLYGSSYTTADGIRLDPQVVTPAPDRYDLNGGSDE